jgi:cyclase
MRLPGAQSRIEDAMKTFTRSTLFIIALSLCIMAAYARQDEAPPAMKFNDVKEIAPGVFFRYSAISATDPSVQFGGSNHVWIVFKDYVVVIDANFPKEAGDVIAAIKKTTDKPIRYVLDTHHHGDHAYGNSVWAKEGAKIIGHANCARLLKTSGPKQWEEAARQRRDVAQSELKLVDIPFDDKYEIDDGTQRVEFHFLGHAHTPGDAVAYLPKHRILCTGDACVNGAFNFMGHSDTASWIKVLDKMAQFDVKWICPGHGPVAGKDLLAKQKRYFTDMRTQIKKAIDDGKQLDDLGGMLDMAWYKEWTGKEARDIRANVRHVYEELTGKIDHSKLGYTDRRPGYGQYANRDAEEQARSQTTGAK